MQNKFEEDTWKTMQVIVPQESVNADKDNSELQLQLFTHHHPAECLYLFFIHLKLELLPQFPASNDEKYFYLLKIYWINWASTKN